MLPLATGPRAKEPADHGRSLRDPEPNKPFLYRLGCVFHHGSGKLSPRFQGRAGEEALGCAAPPTLPVPQTPRTKVPRQRGSAGVSDAGRGAGSWDPAGAGEVPSAAAAVPLFSDSQLPGPGPGPRCLLCPRVRKCGHLWQPGLATPTSRKVSGAQQNAGRGGGALAPGQRVVV